MAATYPHPTTHYTPITAEPGDDEENPDYDPWEDLIDYAESRYTEETPQPDQSPGGRPAAGYS